MTKAVMSGISAAVVTCVLTLASSAQAQQYELDGAHTSIGFHISHLGLSYTYGRFTDFSGQFSIDTADPSKSSFSLTIQVASVDTANKKRDDHLRSPDFFNAKQFPTITFKSTSVKPVEGGLEVTGDFTLHGVTKPITVTLEGGKTAEFPKGVMRTGYSGEVTLKRSDFGMDKMLEAVGDEVHIAISFEGTQK